MSLVEQLPEDPVLYASRRHPTIVHASVTFVVKPTAEYIFAVKLPRGINEAGMNNEVIGGWVRTVFYSTLAA
jgi:hypothetical protein